MKFLELAHVLVAESTTKASPVVSFQRLTAQGIEIGLHARKDSVGPDDDQQRQQQPNQQQPGQQQQQQQQQAQSEQQPGVQLFGELCGMLTEEYSRTVERRVLGLLRDGEEGSGALSALASEIEPLGLAASPELEGAAGGAGEGTLDGNIKYSLRRGLSPSSLLSLSLSLSLPLPPPCSVTAT